MNLLEKALAETREKQALKDEVVKPLGEEIIGLLRNRGLTTKQGQEVVLYVSYELQKIAENTKM